MSRKIYCKCGDYVGEIRDAKLKKGLTFVCDKCSRKQGFIDKYIYDQVENDRLGKMSRFFKPSK